MFEKGSIIQRPVDGIKGVIGFLHMGIYVGKGYVIHFDGEGSSGSNKSGKIVKVSLKEFAKGYKVVLREAPHSIEHALAVVSRAYNFLYSGKFNGKYDMFSCNCQDFVYECFTGYKYCKE